MTFQAQDYLTPQGRTKRGLDRVTRQGPLPQVLTVSDETADVVDVVYVNM
jgi:hypothetical protein